MLAQQRTPIGGGQLNIGGLIAVLAKLLHEQLYLARCFTALGIQSSIFLEKCDESLRMLEFPRSDDLHLFGRGQHVSLHIDVGGVGEIVQRQLKKSAAGTRNMQSSKGSPKPIRNQVAFCIGELTTNFPSRTVT